MRPSVQHTQHLIFQQSISRWTDFLLSPSGEIDFLLTQFHDLLSDMYCLRIVALNFECVYEFWGVEHLSSSCSR